MIEIIKHGVPKTDIHYRFKCGRCGCEWFADSKDYTSYSGGMGHEWVSCHCPECDNVESRDTAEQTRNLTDVKIAKEALPLAEEYKKENEEMKSLLKLISEETNCLATFRYADKIEKLIGK